MRHLLVAAALAAALPFPAAAGQFEKIAPVAQGRVGVAAQLLESGETASLHGDEHFPMHSVAADLDGGLAVFSSERAIGEKELLAQVQCLCLYCVRTKPIADRSQELISVHLIPDGKRGRRCLHVRHGEWSRRDASGIDGSSRRAT